MSKQQTVDCKNKCKACGFEEICNYLGQYPTIRNNDNNDGSHIGTMAKIGEYLIQADCLWEVKNGRKV